MSPKILASAVAALAFALPAAAQTATPRVDQRQANQERRIDQGVQSGQLNAKEAARLDKGQDKEWRVARDAANGARDGELVEAEAVGNRRLGLPQARE